MANVNDHSTAIVPIETWAFQSPRLRRGGGTLDMGLLAEALIYYDQLWVVPSSAVAVARVIDTPQTAPVSPEPDAATPPPFVELVEWFVQRELFPELLELLRDGTLGVYHYAFRTVAIEKGGEYQVWNAQEEDEKSGDSFRRRILYHSSLNRVLARSRDREKLFKAIEGRIREVTASDFGPAVQNARLDTNDSIAAAAAVQSFVDEFPDLLEGIAPATVEATVRRTPPDKTHLTFNLSFERVAHALGPKVGFNASLVLSGLAHSNRVLWSAATESTDLYLPQPLSHLSSLKLAESDGRRGRTGELINELEARVEFPDVRALVNAGELTFNDVLKLRRNARQFRKWLQNEADRDRDALIAYHHEVAKQSGFARYTLKTLKIFGALGGAAAGVYVEGPIGAAVGGTVGPRLVEVVTSITEDATRYVFDLAGKLDQEWRPVVFGDWARGYVEKARERRTK